MPHRTPPINPRLHCSRRAPMKPFNEWTRTASVRSEKPGRELAIRRHDHLHDQWVAKAKTISLPLDIGKEDDQIAMLLNRQQVYRVRRP